MELGLNVELASPLDVLPELPGCRLLEAIADRLYRFPAVDRVALAAAVDALARPRA